MIKIIYEIYANDYTRKNNNVMYFNTYDELYDWIKANAYINPYHPHYPFFPYNDYNSKISFSSQTINPYPQLRYACSIWIHLIESDKGIEFTNGKFTSGQKHKSKQMNELFLLWDKQIRQKQTYNFVE